MIKQIGIVESVVSWLDKASVIAFIVVVLFYVAHFFDGLPEVIAIESGQEGPDLKVFWPTDMVQCLNDELPCYIYGMGFPNAITVHKYFKDHNFEAIDKVIFTHEARTLSNLGRSVAWSNFLRVHANENKGELLPMPVKELPVTTF